MKTMIMTVNTLRPQQNSYLIKVLCELASYKGGLEFVIIDSELRERHLLPRAFEILKVKSCVSLSV